jgi:hypothetical protein
LILFTKPQRATVRYCTDIALIDILHTMTDVTRGLTHKDYTVGWICALPIESVAAQAMLDERHNTLPSHPHGQNAYALWRIGNHNIVIACPPKYQISTNSVAVVSTTMRFSFPSIRFGFMVGIGGGVPNISKKIMDNVDNLLMSQQVLASAYRGGLVSHPNDTRTRMASAPASPQTISASAVSPRSSHRPRKRKPEHDLPPKPKRFNRGV